jgi:hypothetical protein
MTTFRESMGPVVVGIEIPAKQRPRSAINGQKWKNRSPTRTMFPAATIRSWHGGNKLVDAGRGDKMTATDIQQPARVAGVRPMGIVRQRGP